MFHGLLTSTVALRWSDTIWFLIFSKKSVFSVEVLEFFFTSSVLILQGAGIGKFASIVLSLGWALPIWWLLCYKSEKLSQVTSYLPFSCPLFLWLLFCVLDNLERLSNFLISSLRFLILYILVLLSGRFLQVYWFYFNFKFLTYLFGYSLNSLFLKHPAFSSWM